MNEDGQYTVVWKSSKIDNSLNPVWGTVKISMNSLCNGDIHRPLKIEIFDWDSNGKHDTMGHVSAAVWALCVYGELFEYHCRNLLYMYTFFIYNIIDKWVSISALIFFCINYCWTGGDFSTGHDQQPRGTDGCDRASQSQNQEDLHKLWSFSGRRCTHWTPPHLHSGKQLVLYSILFYSIFFHSIFFYIICIAILFIYCFCVILFLRCFYFYI